LTQRLLAFGRRQSLKPDIVQLPAMVHGIADLLRGSFGPGVAVELRLPESLPAARVDASQLELALLNLAANARDAMPGGGRVIFSAREAEVTAEDTSALPPGQYVVLGVADTGEGMDEATLAQAVEPFFTTKSVGKGTGLGLSMVHGLAAQSGGRLLLRSRKGEGTVAELWLPRTEALPAAPLPAPEPPRSPMAHGRTVLLVDDDALVRGSIAAMLEDLGHTAIEASSGDDALDVLDQTGAVDLVITDYAMPGMTGVQLAEELRRRRPDLPVLLATGYAELPGSTAGVQQLAKPFRSQVLARAIEQCVAS
jgi:CheY-like chemotaxis protein